jgi:histidinol phosphatase-like PHP family hydrolase
MLTQDLHIHTTWSTGDSSIVPEQTIPLIAAVRHARIAGISDHFNFLGEDNFDAYKSEVQSHGFKLGTEISGSEWTAAAVRFPFDYFIYHCKDSKQEYRGIEKLLSTGKPVIIAHPFTMGTEIDKVPSECFIEINNRYIWRHQWERLLIPYIGQRRFVISSDAHQPNWLNQTVARYVAATMGIEETLVFKKDAVPALSG